MINFGKIYLDDCIAVTGNDRTGRFLHRLVKWHPRTNIIRSGRRWVAWPRARWMTELQLTANQFRLVLVKLKASGLIECKQYLRNGLNVLHVSLTDKCLQQLAKSPEPLTGAGGKALTGVSGKPLTLYKNPNNEPGESTKTASGFAVAIPEAEEVKEFGKSDNLSEAKDLENKEFAVATQLTADAVKTHGHPHEVELDLPDKVSTLEAVWQQGFVGKGLPMPTITMKMRGQFKYLIKTRPAGTMPMLVAFAIKNWDDVTYAAQKHHAAFKCPDNPELGFLVKFAHVAIDEFLKAVKKAEAQAKAQEYVPKAPSHWSKPSMADLHGPATLAEILAIDEEFEATPATDVVVNHMKVKYDAQVAFLKAQKAGL